MRSRPMHNTLISLVYLLIIFSTSISCSAGCIINVRLSEEPMWLDRVIDYHYHIRCIYRPNDATNLQDTQSTETEDRKRPGRRSVQKATEMK